MMRGNFLNLFHKIHKVYKKYLIRNFFLDFYFSKFVIPDLHFKFVTKSGTYIYQLHKVFPIYIIIIESTESHNI